MTAAADCPRARGSVSVRTTEVPAGGYRIYARHLLPSVDPGGGPPVVVVHGMVLAGRGTLPLARALAARGFTVHLPDLPGFGRSAKPRRALDVPGLGTALADWIGAMALGPAVLLGNSFGTQVAAAAAGRHGLASAVVLVAPTIDVRYRRGWATRLPAGRPGGPARAGALGWLQARLVDRLVPADPSPPVRDLRSLIVSEYLAAGPARALSTYRHALRDDLADRVGGIPVPLTVVRGERDGLVSPAWAERVAAAAPEGRLVVVPGVDHDGQFNRPDALADAVRSALAIAAPGRGADGR